MIKQLNATVFVFIFVFCFVQMGFSDFVIGLYGVKTEQDVIAAKEAGFNCVQTYVREPETIKVICKQAAKNDMTVLAYPDKIISSKYKEEALSYPIKAWYLFDEPDVWNFSRENLISLNKSVKEIYPQDKTVFVIGEGFTKTPYYDIADILMVDWYPVPHLPLESLGENVALAKQGLIMSAQDDKPLWAVIQIFDWKQYKQYRKDNDRIGRFPKKEEIRFMSYDAIFNGASGLFYFTCYCNGKPLFEDKPKEWANVFDVIQEISFVAEIKDNGKKIDNPVQIKEPLKAESYEYGGIKYTFVINPTPKRQSLPPVFFEPKFDVMYEKSTNLRKNIRKAKNNFKPYKVFAFRYE